VGLLGVWVLLHNLAGWRMDFTASECKEATPYAFLEIVRMFMSGLWLLNYHEAIDFNTPRSLILKIKWRPVLSGIATIQGSSLDMVLRISVPFPSVERHKLFHHFMKIIQRWMDFQSAIYLSCTRMVPQDFITCSSACRG
jgi:hypothetical protein